MSQSLQDLHVCFGLPAYGGQLTASFFTSWVTLQTQMVRNGLRFSVLCLQNESLITRGRNHIVARMLADPTTTHLMFIDSDIVFEPDDFFRLLYWNQEVVTATYSTKSIDWSKIIHLAREGVDESRIVRQMGRQSHNLMPNGYRIESSGQNGPKGVLHEAYDATTGFMLIKRQVLETLRAANPHLEYDAGRGKVNGERTFALFDTAIDPSNGIYLSEDFYFCRLWQRLGGKVFVDLDIHLGHMGAVEYRI